MSTPKTIKICKASLTYTILESSATLLPWELNLTLFKTSFLLSWTLCILHILTSFALAIIFYLTESQPPWRILLALSAEFFLTLPESFPAINIFYALFVFGGSTQKHANPRPARRLQGSTAPLVDIMITCCGEPVETVINTIAAAAAQDYPAKQLRIFVLDDGHDDQLRHAIALLKLHLTHRGSEYPLIVYLSRTVGKGEQSYFKSGNLRFGINSPERLASGGGSEFLAGLDADMIAEPDWLRRMVPHLLVDDRLAIVCGPQNYYNVPPKDPLGQQSDFDIYFTVQEVLNDSLDAPMCTGTGYVARCSAIEEIGGWPLAYAGEDYMCSALLSGAGWRLAFVREPLQTGLAPESLSALVKQRTRWTDAGLEVHQRLGPYSTTSPLTARMIPSVRAVNMLYLVRDYSPVTTTLAIVLLPLALLSSNTSNGAGDDVLNSLATKYDTYLFWSQRLFLTYHLVHAAHVLLMYKHVGLSRVANIQSHELWTAPYTAYRCLSHLASLSPLLNKSKSPHFKTWGGSLTASATNERSTRHRAPLLYRLLRPDIIVYILYSNFASAALYGILASHYYSLNSRSLFPFPSLLVKLMACAWGISKPVWYMIWPPTAMEWEELVVEDEDGVKRPKMGWGSGKVERGVGTGWIVYSLCEVGIVLACCWR